jgi:hypothetical protein
VHVPMCWLDSSESHLSGSVAQCAVKTPAGALGSVACSAGYMLLHGGSTVVWSEAALCESSYVALFICV